MPPADTPRGMEAQGLENAGVFGTGIMHWIFFGIVLILLITAVVVYVRSRKRARARAEGTEHKEIHSTDL